MNQQNAEEYTQALTQVIVGGWRQIALAERLGVPKALGLSMDAWVQQTLGGYIKLSIEERRQAAIELAAEGHSQRAIGRVLGVDVGTINKDLRVVENSTGAEKTPRKTGVFASADVENSTLTEPLGILAGLTATNDVRQAAETKAARAAREQLREQQREANAAKVAQVSDPRELLKVGRFSTIAIDPPWDFGDEGDVDPMGLALPSYATMSIDKILLLPVDDLAADDCHLYLWITNRSFRKGFRLLDAWGFRHVTNLTWHKPGLGLGKYFRGVTEHVLFGVRGSQPLKRHDVATLFEAPRSGHSRKPEKFFELVESCSPGPYLEMFGRPNGGSREGWTVWGECSAKD